MIDNTKTNCLYCKIEMLKYPISQYKNGVKYSQRGCTLKYCSNKCFGLSRRKAKTTKKCIQCSQEFKIKNGYYIQKFCSRSCVAKYNLKLPAIHTKRFIENKVNNKYCLWCNIELKGLKKSYCSKICASNFSGSKIYITKKVILVKLLGSKCQLCGYDKCIQSLVFHHKDPTTKKFNLSHGLQRSMPIEDLINEAKKCLLLCANCHFELHYNHKLDQFIK